MSAVLASNAALLLGLAIQATQAGLSYATRVADAQAGGPPVSDEEVDAAAAAVGTSRAKLLAADAARTALEAGPSPLG